MDWIIRPSSLNGSLTLPPSKSHTLRALLFASLAEGACQLENLLESPDVDAMERCLKERGGDVGNSGITLRFLTALLAHQKEPVTLTGDASIRTRRTLAPLLAALGKLGVKAQSHQGFAPVTMQGPLQAGRTEVEGYDSQFVSALLIACSLSEGPTEIVVHNAGEHPWIDLTLSWLDRVGLSYERKGYEWFRLPGAGKVRPFQYCVPGDLSGLAFPIVAALATRSTVKIEGVDLSDPQGDKEIVAILRAMGAEFSSTDSCLTVHPSKLKGQTFDLNACIDAVPAMAVAACFAEGVTTFTGISGARYKECDRLACSVRELSQMGAHIQETEDGLRIVGSPLRGAEVSSHQDHRMAMALAVAAMGAEGESVVTDTACVHKTFPKFAEKFQSIGATLCVFSSTVCPV